ncbi:hypothetical protein OG552_30830 [Streptomyces sp. NBC_01476]|nr:hypothetical protein [Streptomyces sp. NBC_01476]
MSGIGNVVSVSASAARLPGCPAARRPGGPAARQPSAAGRSRGA